MNFVKKFRYLFLSLLLFLSFGFTSYADDFNSLDINVAIDKNANASVKEVWDTVDENGTEKYKPIENLGQIKITDFKAKVNGKSFTQVSPWDVDKSFDEKAHKYGINKTNKGIELCWGITSYGHNIHEISYKVNPIVIELNDYDMLYWKFINDSMDPEPEKAKITIKAYKPFDKEVKMWGFGMEGEIHNKDGAIVMESNGDITYGVVMLRFPKGYFQTPYKIDRNFKAYADMAIEGSDWQNKQGSVDEDSEKPPLALIIAIPIIIVLSIIGIFSAVKSGSIMGKLDRDKKFPKVKALKGQYFQEVPYDKDIENLYIFAKKAYPKIKQDNFLNAFILKWIYQGKIEFKEEEAGLFKKKTQAIKLLSKPENMGELEGSFFDKLTKASLKTKDGIIDQKALEKYIRTHTKEMETFFDKFEINSALKLENEAYIKSIRQRKTLVKITNLDPTDEGIELYANLIKFKNYLLDYSLIRERDVNEVKIWDYFMIYAAMYGIAEEVFENLEKTYPEYTSNSIYSYRMIMWSTSYANSINTSYENFVAQGSGGATSFGGGGGSFGGGSGGGSR
ncbi:MAG: DUF2207 domain-containing protein [Peptoniphilaceae bacterium]|nr:DUF2207 domain-containing protein [Peptoniphilaceae bacterium]MDY6019310.1 DUF2207 domain-containing protein [Anaerococcus sp.]